MHKTIKTLAVIGVTALSMSAFAASSKSDALDDVISKSSKITSIEKGVLELEENREFQYLSASKDGNLALTYLQLIETKKMNQQLRQQVKHQHAIEIYALESNLRLTQIENTLKQMARRG